MTTLEKLQLMLSDCELLSAELENVRTIDPAVKAAITTPINMIAVLADAVIELTLTCLQRCDNASSPTSDADSEVNAVHDKSGSSAPTQPELPPM